MTSPFKRKLIEAINQQELAILGGGFPDFESYKYALGVLAGLIQSKDLLTQKEPESQDDNPY